MNRAALTLMASGAMVAGPAHSSAQAEEWELLRRSFDLAAPPSLETQRYRMESKMMSHGPDGTIVKTDIFRLKLECEPGTGAGGSDRWTCLEFTIELAGSPQVAIPSLSGWSYLFSPDRALRQADKRTLGIPHEPFRDLTDATGKAVPPVETYHVYNAFIDFHAFIVFAEKTHRGGGVQDLHHIGQRIVHAGSHSRPAVDLGGTVAPGSYFENGEVTLELKGLGMAQGRACAILGYDSGRSSFLMIMNPAPGVEVRTVGSSHYWGDIYKDVRSHWVRKATLTELVVSETTPPGGGDRVHGVAERAIAVENVTDLG